MTLEEARQLALSFNKSAFKLFIERAEIRQEPNGEYALAVEPVEGEQQIFRDAEKAYLVLYEGRDKFKRANDRYFRLSKDGTVVECDRETWSKDWPNRHKTRIRIVCSREIEATISFVGWAPPAIHMDGNVRLWLAQFYSSAKDEHYCGTTFDSFEETNRFVDRYISKGCPPSGVPFRLFLSDYLSDYCNSRPQ